MALLRLRRASQLTLPSDVRDALKVKVGDYLEARVVKDGVLLKPVSIVARQRAWAGIVKAASAVRDRARKRKHALREDERAIAREVKKARRA